VNAPEAWTYTTGSREVVIALLDDGVEIDHQTCGEYFFMPTKMVSTRRQRLRGDFNGWDFYEDSSDPGRRFPRRSRNQHGWRGRRGRG